MGKRINVSRAGSGGSKKKTKGGRIPIHDGGQGRGERLES